MARNPLMAFIDASKKPPRNPGIAGVEEREINPDTPVLEYYEGDNNAWRGTEQHGVATKDHAKAYEGEPLGENNTTTFVPEPKIVDPIDVRVVNEFPNEIRRARLFSYPVNDQPAQLVNARTSRYRLFIKNIDVANSIFLNSKNNVNVVTAFELKPGAEISLSTEEEMWAICAATLTAKAQVIDEYSVKVEVE